MFLKLKLSFGRINYKLYFALLVLGLVPTIYTTVRVFFLGQLPGEWSFSIAGQLTWINLLYEILNEVIILPLFYFIGKVILDKKESKHADNYDRRTDNGENKRPALALVKVERHKSAENGKDSNERHHCIDTLRRTSV